MAMTLTIDTPRRRNWIFSGSQKKRRGTGNLGAYATNGVAIGATELKALGLKTLDHLDVASSLDGSTLFAWDKANSKIKAFSAVGTEVVDTTNIASKVFRFQAEGL